MFRRFRERTREMQDRTHQIQEQTHQMQEELAEKRAANQVARRNLLADFIRQAERFKDPGLRKEAIEAAMRPFPAALAPSNSKPSGGQPGSRWLSTSLR